MCMAIMGGLKQQRGRGLKRACRKTRLLVIVVRGRGDGVTRRNERKQGAWRGTHIIVGCIDVCAVGQQLFD
jgi:hypothetical protein